ncbi:MAG TPA: protein kinase [Gammaproteobacteria bacterium]|nr:protein kinase [Gammaproteobacteria bacterium]
MTALRDQQIRALYRAALERPVGERASFVAELTGGDQELRESVELLLSQHDATDIGAAQASHPHDAADELPAGALLGHYRIDGVLGRGGMGVVYRATDTKLNRPVAIKFLSAGIADDDARRRFRQEAKTASGLNHPHIVTVYDVGEIDGRQFIVSELVDGGTLEDWAAAKRRRTWRQGVELVTGVADALAAAHAAGVLHRDVKPSNVLIDGNGYAKLADFGLAKLVDSHDAGHEGRKAARTTRAGVVVGTVAYMSPEQATGQPVDARSDVFSFGVLLYELLAHRRPFEASNELEVLKSIAHAPPAPLPDTIPELLRMAVDKALEKDPAERYQTMRDLHADLRRVVRKPNAVPSGARRNSRLPWLAAGLLAAALIAALVPATLYFRRAAPPLGPQIRFDVPIPGYVVNGLTVSPDGTRITYAAVTNGVRQVWSRPLGASEARPIAGTEGMTGGVFWSPDGNQLAFITDLKIKKVPIGGGIAQTLADTGPAPFGGDWAANGTILYTATAGAAPAGGSGLMAVARISATGSDRTVLTGSELGDPANGEVAHILPRWLPDGDHFIYAAAANAANDSTVLYVESLTTPGRKPLLTVGSNVATVPNIAYSDGFLLYPRGGSLAAQRFDPDELALVGEPITLVESIREFAVAGGVLAYTEPGADIGAAGTARRLAWFDRNGQRLEEVETPGPYRLPALSPDGRRVVICVGIVGAEFADVWIIDTVRGIPTRLTTHPAEDSPAIWSPDGNRIVFGSGRDAIPGLPSSLYERAANGAGADRRLYSGTIEELIIPMDWSRDSRFIVFGRANINTWQTKVDLWVLPTTGDEPARALLDSPFRRAAARLSPDSRWIAYTTNESGSDNVVVRPFPDVNRGQWQISKRGGTDAHWRDDGREIVYLDPDGVLTAVEVRSEGESFESGTPRALFATGLITPRGDELPDLLYDMTGDGQRFLISEPVPNASAPAAAPTLKVIVNWSAGLER